MSYVSGNRYLLPTIDTNTAWSRIIGASAATGNGSTYPKADLAIYVPVRISSSVIVRKLYAHITTAAGNVDLGIFDLAGTKLLSTGAVAASTSGVFDVTDTLFHQGIYYLGITATSTSLAIAAAQTAAPFSAAVGVCTEQLSAGAALPGTATLSVSQTHAFIPSLGALLNATNS